MPTIWQELRCGLGMLRKNPAAAAIAVLTLTLGIGANSAVVGWASATRLDAIPGTSHPGQLVSVIGGAPGHLSTLSYPADSVVSPWSSRPSPFTA